MEGFGFVRGAFWLFGDGLVYEAGWWILCYPISVVVGQTVFFFQIDL